MGTHDPRVDDYIARSAAFAKPILTHIRTVVHSAVPEASETMKWSFPHFEYRGILCSMAAFKAHCALNFWKAPLLFGEAETSKEAMGQMGRITSIRDLPSKRELTRLLKEAARLNSEGVKAPQKKGPRVAKDAPAIPEELAAALAKNRRAREAFERFAPSHRREYIQWIAEAKTEATRQRRLAQAIEWIAEGKSRYWKYERK